MTKRSLPLTSAIAVTLLTGALSVGAQEANEQGLDEVVVTAQKREQSSLDVPMSVTAVTGEQPM